MRAKSTRARSLFLVLTLLATACSRVVPTGEDPVAILDATPGASSAPGDSLADDGRTFEGPTASDPLGPGVPGPGEPGSPGQDDTGAAPGNGPTSEEDDGDSGPTAATRSGPGVDGRTVKIAFHAHLEDCPNHDNEPGDDERAKGRLVIDEYVRFFNEFMLDEHGWQLEHTVLDDGGHFCPERQRSAALKIAQEIEPFAALGSSSSAQGPIVADVVTRAGIVHAGTNWQLQSEEAARHPYAWNVATSADKSLRFLVSWMERRIKGTPVPDRSTPTNTEVERVYGILGLDDELARLAKQDMAAAGMEVAGVYLASYDPGVTAQQVSTTVAKMRQDGVNTLVWTGTIQGSSYYIPLTETMTAQNYLPDIITDWGNSFFAQLANKRVWDNAKGSSAWSAIALRVELDADGTPNEKWSQLNENLDGYIAAWQEKLGHNDSPQEGAYPNAYGTWGQLSLLATGIMHAGEMLNAETFAAGLESAARRGSPTGARSPASWDATTGTCRPSSGTSSTTGASRGSPRCTGSTARARRTRPATTNPTTTTCTSRRRRKSPRSRPTTRARRASTSSSRSRSASARGPRARSSRPRRSERASGGAGGGE